ncbi:unnamed protein product [Rhizoctonia solani]|uniref:Ethanolaminephosphotransferase n=1 Tax=Rhizoctonia solani TaxID=456999 RepID=A0A8H3DNI0_9AGAM|nr:unnamed protein product [Rhizoctonia solani]
MSTHEIPSVACIGLYEPDLKTPGPTWLYLSFALGLFLYQTFDNVDGRQARKTGTSSALGHVFDHGIDTLNCPLGGLVQVASLGLGHSVNGAFFVLIGCVPMWLSTWEEYYTGTLYLGYINVLIAVFVVHAPVCFMNVHEACKTKGISFASAIGQNLSFATYIGLCWFWATSPYSSLLSSTTNLVPPHGGLIEFTLLVVCTFGRMLPRVIIAHLTHGPFPTLLPSVILPILGGVLIVNLNHFGWHITPAVEIWYIHAALVYSFISWQHWAVVACLRFAEVLGINCLTIKPKKA